MAIEGNSELDRVALVLLSGGIDSATALALMHTSRVHLSTLFINYGQPAAATEANAASGIAGHYGIPHHELELIGLSFGGGEIRGRNAFLLHLALLASKNQTGLIIIGLHSGTPYRDCSPLFLQLIQDSYDFHTAGTISVAAPFIDRHKSEVFDLAIELQVPLEMTYSCERGTTPCGVCLSCRDREALLARP